MSLKGRRSGADVMSMSFRRVLVVGLLIAGVMGGASSQPSAAAAPGGPDPDHPFSEPDWYPLRNTARVSCVKTNCEGPYHGFDAVDLAGELGDPIYAAGAGIFHVGNVDPSCPADHSTAGTWVWIDHGPAGRTRYSHLDSIVAVEGQLVTPGTQIGTVGHSGQQAPCPTNYLHFEYRAEASSDSVLPLRSLRACIGGDTVLFPEHLGYSEWDDIPGGPGLGDRRVFTPESDNSCLPSVRPKTPDQPSATVQPGVEQLAVTPSARPGDVDAVRVRVELFHPSLGRYGAYVKQTIPPTQSVATFSDLLPGRTYRALVSFHNDAGWSAWSDAVTGVPGVMPTPPELRDLEATRSTIGYKWHRGSNLDAEYDVAIRPAAGATWGPWTVYDVPPPDIHYRFRELASGTKHQVKVRARNEFGISDWASPQTITTLGESDGAPGAFTTLTPTRYADSRSEPTFDGRFRATGPRAAGTTWEIEIAGRGEVPSDARAAIVNVTALNAAGPGFATVHPCGKLPTASSVNYGPGAIEPNEVITKLSGSGRLCVYTLTSADIIVDVVGYVASSSPYEPLTPSRFADSRDQATFDGDFRATGVRRAGTSWAIDVAGRDDVPAAASAAVVNVTVTGASAPGFATVYPCGDLPTASSLNYGPGMTIPNELIAKLSDDGRICVYVYSDVHVIVDVVGYLEDVPAYTALVPMRYADSRDESTFDDAYRETGRREAGTEWEIAVGGRGRVPSGASFVVANLTVTGGSGPGFATVHPCGGVPNASSLNYDVGVTRPNEVVAKLSDDDSICVFTLAGTHVIVDVVGYG